MSGSPDRRWSPAAARLVETIASAVETFEEPPVLGGLVPAGSPVVRGRVHLGRSRSRLPIDGPVAVQVGFAKLVWQGGTETDVPPVLGTMVYRAQAEVDRRGRLVLDRHARAWLAVTDPAMFEALVMPAPAGGVLVVPLEDFTRRTEVVAP